MIDQIPPLAALAAAFAELSGAKVKDVAKYMPPNDDKTVTKAQHKRAALGMHRMAKVQLTHMKHNMNLLNNVSAELNGVSAMYKSTYKNQKFLSENAWLEGDDTGNYSCFDLTF